MEEQKKLHFLVASLPNQGSITPALQLARVLVAVAGAAVTFFTTSSCRRRMFPDHEADQGGEVEDGLITYIAFNDTFDGFTDSASYLEQMSAAGRIELSAALRRLKDLGRPVDCVVYGIAMSWAVDAAVENRIPAVLHWFQPATVFAVFYHYFHGYEALIADLHKSPSSSSSVLQLPGLPPLRDLDLPSSLTKNAGEDDRRIPMATIFGYYRDLYRMLDEDGYSTRILFNTFDALESAALQSIGFAKPAAIGPLIEFSGGGGRSLLADDEKPYMEWLDGRAEGSVVYLSFGSLAMVKEEQIGELRRGLEASKRAYLWVVRKENRSEKEEEEEFAGDGAGMVVEWCDQARFLSHPAVGCFVTHCGWNSLMESLVAGVPVVCMPVFSDQPTNAKLAAEEWGIGVRAKFAGGEEGIVAGEELERCLEVVMGDGEAGEEIRRKTKMLRSEAKEAAGEVGSSRRNLLEFAEEVKRWSEKFSGFICTCLIILHLCSD